MKSTPIQKANKLFFLISKLICLVGLFYIFYYLYIYEDFKDDKNLVKYAVINSIKHSGGKGDHYSMDILYNNEPYNTSLTSKEYYDLQKEKFPNVYFYKNELLTNWVYEQHKRHIYVLLALLILVSISNRYYNKQLQK